jgi:RNA polymerase sigma-70 factor (ECF subfamily)
MLVYVAKGSPIEITTDTPDIFLVAAAKDGDHQAYAELCHRHSKQILRTVLRLTRDIEDAEDALQEALLKAYLHIDGFEGRSTFCSWLTRIAVNSALMILRKKWSRAACSLGSSPDVDDFKLPEPAETAPNPEESCIQNALEKECVRAIRLLPPALQAVMQMRYREDASVAEIAQTLSISVAAVKSRLLRARSKIRSHFDENTRPRYGHDPRSHTTVQLRLAPSMQVPAEQRGRDGMKTITPLYVCEKGNTPKSEREHLASNQSPRKYRILCVDDDLAGLDLRAALLEEEGYSVTTATCPLMALKYDVSQFHLAILDFDMPALNGYQLLLRLRAALASFPIILLSGMIDNLPNDMRNLFSSCHDKAEPINLLLSDVRSCLNSIPNSPEYSVMGSDAHPMYARYGSDSWENEGIGIELRSA